MAVDSNPFDDFDNLVRTAWATRGGMVHRQEDLVGGIRRPQRTADHAGRLDVSRQLRWKPCCSPNEFTP